MTILKWNKKICNSNCKLHLIRSYFTKVPEDVFGKADSLELVCSAQSETACQNKAGNSKSLQTCSGKEERLQLFPDQLITHFWFLFLVGGCNNQMTHKCSMETLEKYSVWRMFLLCIVQLLSFIELLMLRFRANHSLGKWRRCFKLAVAITVFLDGWESEILPVFCSWYCFFFHSSFLWILSNR